MTVGCGGCGIEIAQVTIFSSCPNAAFLFLQPMQSDNNEAEKRTLLHQMDGDDYDGSLNFNDDDVNADLPKYSEIIENPSLETSMSR